MENLLEFQEDLANKYKYKKLNEQLSKEVRQKYLDNLHECLNINGDEHFEIRSLSGTLVAKGYERIVIGDYGAFLEMKKDQIVRDNIKCKKGQEYRYRDEKFKSRVKYFWYTAKDDSDIKIYLQQRTVTYADYKPDMVYISPFEILI